jgi:hypothetical protein
MIVVVTNEDRAHFVQNEDLKEKFTHFKNLREAARNLFFEFLDLSLSDCEVSQDIPSKVAAACIVAARRHLELLPLWPVELSKITKYTYKELINPMCLLVSLRAAGAGNLRCPKRKKYGTNTDSGFLTDDSDMDHHPSQKKVRSQKR